MKLSLLPSLVAFWATGALVFGQSTVKPAADPFASSASQPVSEPTGVPNGPDIMVRLEVFSMSPAAARGALKKFPKQTDLYAWIDTELSKPNSAISLEKVSLLRMPSGYRTKIELIAEYPYPTDFDPAQVPQMPASIGIGVPAPVSAPTANPMPPAPVPPAPKPVPSKAPEGEVGAPGLPGPLGLNIANWPSTPATPTAFAVRNTGTTCEIEGVLADDGKTVKLLFAPESVRLAELVSMDQKGDIKQPIFNTEKLNSALSAKLGEPTLAAAYNPATGTNTSKTPEVNRNLFFFLTVTLPE